MKFIKTFLFKNTTGIIGDTLEIVCLSALIIIAAMQLLLLENNSQDASPVSLAVSILTIFWVINSQLNSRHLRRHLPPAHDAYKNKTKV